MTDKHQDSAEYLQKKSFYRQLLTVYGRKPVLEALHDKSLPAFRLHLAESNKPSSIIADIKALAESKNIEVIYHDRLALSRISKNGKQDQGVCLDIHCPNHQDYQDFFDQLSTSPQKIRLLALDRITNPQNLGMIIRSACAGNIDGILIPEKGCAKLDALVIKASTGTLFKAPILRCDKLEKALEILQKQQASIVGLSSHAKHTLGDFQETDITVYVLGNETDGISDNIATRCNKQVRIPMNNHVESLNVAVTASLLAFKGII